MYKLGIDLGGTNIVAGVVDENYNIVATAERKTNAGRPAAEILDDMAAAALEAMGEAGIGKTEIEAAGVGVPGSVDPDSGMVYFCDNLRFLNVPMAQMLKERTGIDFYLENDANAAAYGEFIAGSGAGNKNFILITLGTGVGGGIILDGKIYTGSNYAGGELGHMVIEMDGEMCNCGRQGCWEAYASATALIRQTKQAMVRYPKSLLWQMCDNNIDAVNGRTAFDAMRGGDSVAKRVVDKYVDYIALGITNLINIFQPDVVCIGGGISKEGDNLVLPIREYVEGENYARNVDRKTEINVASLGNDAGIIGAAYICNLYK